MRKSSKKSKPKPSFPLEKPFKANKELVEELERMLYYAPPKQLNRTLRKLFIGYLEHHLDGLPTDFNDTIFHLYLLFEFLDKADEGASG